MTTQAAVDAASSAAIRATWFRPPGLARFPEELTGATSVVEATTSASEQKIESAAKAEPVVGSMGRSEPSGNDATSKGNGKNNNKDLIEKGLAFEGECDGKVSEQKEQTYMQLKKHQLEGQIVRIERTLAHRRTVARRNQVRDELLAQYRRSRTVASVALCLWGRRETRSERRASDDDEDKLFQQEFEREHKKRKPYDRDEAMRGICSEAFLKAKYVYLQEWLEEVAKQND